MTNTTRTDAFDTSNATTQASNAAGRALAAVFTDLAIDGRHEELAELYQAEIDSEDTSGPVGPRQLAAFVARLQAIVNAHYARSLKNLTPSTISIDKSKRGQRFLRVVESDTPGGSRRVWGFIEAATGLIWKAATFKAPALNFPRGDIRHLPVRWDAHTSAL